MITGLKSGDEGNMIRLKKISGKNIWDILKLRVRENQRSFVASNDISIIEAYVAQNENGHAFPFGIYNDETPVGFCMIGYGVDDSWTDAPPIAKDSYNIWRLMIDERFQGKGFGRKLIEAGTAELKTLGCDRMLIGCLAGNPSNSFYEHIGGKLIKTRIYERLQLPENVYLFERI